MEKRLYVAYGRNLNILQMKQRCPTAKLCGTGTVENYQLQFKGRPQSAFATISPKEGSSVPVSYTHLDVYKRQGGGWTVGTLPGHLRRDNLRERNGNPEWRNRPVYPSAAINAEEAGLPS